MKEKLTCAEKKCPFCGSSDIEPMGAGHEVGAGEFKREVNKQQYRCRGCENYFWVQKTSAH